MTKAFSLLAVLFGMLAVITGNNTGYATISAGGIILLADHLEDIYLALRKR